MLAVTIPLLIVFMILVGKGAKDRARSRWRALSLLSGHFLDVVRGLETLRAYRREAAQAETIETVCERYRAETMGTLRVAFLSALVLELCAMIGTALVAATIGVQLDGGHLGLQAGLTVLLLAPELYGPLRGVGQQFHASADGLAAAERIFAVLDAPPALGSAPAGRRRRGTGPRPRRRCASRTSRFAYPDRPEPRPRTGLSLELAPGRTTALVGPSGAGKSTIAALALRLADPTRGRVSCGGVDLRDVDARALARARRLGAAAHAPVQRHDRREHRARRPGRRPGAHPCRGRRGRAAGAARAAPRRPRHARSARAGADSPPGRRSGRPGARVPARRPLVVLDEPTAHLDSATAAAVGERDPRAWPRAARRC